MILSRTDMHGYQDDGVDYIVDRTHCGLFLDMGLGKTVTTLTAIEYLIYQELEIGKVLVIAPKRVALSVWPREIHKWDHLKHLRVVPITGNQAQRRRALISDGDIYTIGRENVPWLCSQYGGSRLPFDMLVIDESSSFKNPKSVRFKALRQVQPCFKRVVLLTGTPSPNGLIDLWSQIYLLDRGERLGKYITAFRNKYFDAGARNGHVVYKYILKQGGEEEIHRRISDICMSMKAEDYLDMPDLIDNIVEIDMPEEVKKKYDDFEEEMVLDLFDGFQPGDEISAVNAAALSNKLLQFANGAVYDEMKNFHVVHDLKIEALKELVEDCPGNVLVGWTYKSDEERIHQALKKYKPRKLKDTQDEDDWNDGKIKVLTMHPASGGHGLNLQQGGNTIVWFGQTWSLEFLEQFNARLYRQGQKGKSVVVNKLACKGTLDTRVIKAQASKAQKQDALMAAVKARIKKYFQS